MKVFLENYQKFKGIEDLKRVRGCLDCNPSESYQNFDNTKTQVMSKPRQKKILFGL